MALGIVGDPEVACHGQYPRLARIAQGKWEGCFLELFFLYPVIISLIFDGLLILKGSSGKGI